MKRTSHQGETNNNEQTRCEPALPSGRFHRVIKYNNEKKFNR
jgi:hypothetical protein